MKLTFSLSILTYLALSATRASIHPLPMEFFESKCLQVVDQSGQGIAGMQAKSLDSSITASSDSEGCFNIDPNVLKNIDYLLIEGSGYSSIMLQGPISPQVALEVNPNPDFPELVKIEGNVSGFQGVKNYDGLVNAAIVLSGFQFSDLFHFSPNQFVSQLSHQINAYGKRDIPSNIALPKQRERYLFVNLNFNKPNYTILLPKAPEHHLAALSFDASLNAIIDYAQKDHDVIKLFDKVRFKRSGFLPGVKALLPQSQQDLNLDYEPKQSKSVQFQVDQGYTPLQLTLSQERGSYFPVDLSLKVRPMAVLSPSDELLYGGLKFGANNLPEEGYILRYPFGNKQSLKSHLEKSHLVLETSYDYYLVTLVKTMKRQNTQWNFQESHPKVQLFSFGRGGKKAKIDISAVTDFDQALVVGFNVENAKDYNDLQRIQDAFTASSFIVLNKNK